MAQEPPILFSQVMNFVDLMLNSTKHPLCSTKVFINIKKIYFHSITQKIYGKRINVTALSEPVKSWFAPGSHEPHTPISQTKEFQNAFRALDNVLIILVHLLTRSKKHMDSQE